MAASRIAPQKTDWIVFQLIVVLDGVLDDDVRQSSYRLFQPALRNSLVAARNAGPIAIATTKCDLLRSAPSKETKPS
jgi:hypothetical protein